MKNIKEWFSTNLSTATVIFKNISEFVDASCLAGVSGFAIYMALKHRHEFWYQLLLFAGLVIAIQAFLLLVRHFNKPIQGYKSV